MFYLEDCLLIYGGYAGKILSEKHKDDQYMNVFMMLMFVGALLVLYHDWQISQNERFSKKLIIAILF